MQNLPQKNLGEWVIFAKSPDFPKGFMEFLKAIVMCKRQNQASLSMTKFFPMQCEVVRIKPDGKLEIVPAYTKIRNYETVRKIQTP